MQGKQPHIGIRREDKNRWEGRVPLTPAHVRLLGEQGVRVTVQSSTIRAYSDRDYAAAGATIGEDLTACDVVFAVKEIPAELFCPGTTYVFFSHTIKGQPDNMPMLHTLMNAGGQLIDYELITDENGRRLIFFGRHAGLVGMIDTLWALGRRLSAEGLQTPFVRLQQAIEYADLEAAKAAVSRVGQQIQQEGLPNGLCPLTVGFAGYGNVSQGAQEIFDLLPFETVAPADLRRRTGPTDRLVKVVFAEKDMVEPVEADHSFDLQEYYNHPGRYRSIFQRHLPHLTVLINAIYWDARYPRLVTNDFLRRAQHENALGLKVIGDITCDVGGSIECNVRTTDSGNPVYVYDPKKGQARNGVKGEGPVVLAVDNLPCELPRESSQAFSDALIDFVGAIAKSDYTAPLDQADLPEPIRKAVIVWRGELVGPHRALQEHMDRIERDV